MRTTVGLPDDLQRRAPGRDEPIRVRTDPSTGLPSVRLGRAITCEGVPTLDGEDDENDDTRPQ